MAAIKKYNGSTFVDAAIRKYSTASEIIVPPTTIYTDGTAITSYTLKGNTVQNGTPTPSNPVSVVGVGELETTGEHTGEYKIPILTAQGSAVNYLGSVRSTRQIKKYVCTGQETLRAYDSQYSRIFIQIPDIVSLGIRLTPIMCTHYQGIYDGRPIADVPNNSISSGSPTQDPNGLYIYETDYTSNTDFAAFLATQYNNGTPVTIWYAVSTSETGIVNEPLMKIGTYADSISNAAQIPTTEGANSISVDTTVQPSEFTATWTGWHDSSVKEYDGTNWQ